MEVCFGYLHNNDMNNGIKLIVQSSQNQEQFTRPQRKSVSRNAQYHTNYQVQFAKFYFTFLRMYKINVITGSEQWLYLSLIKLIQYFADSVNKNDGNHMSVRSQLSISWLLRLYVNSNLLKV